MCGNFSKTSRVGTSLFSKVECCSIIGMYLKVLMGCSESPLLCHFFFSQVRAGCIIVISPFVHMYSSLLVLFLLFVGSILFGPFFRVFVFILHLTFCYISNAGVEAGLQKCPPIVLSCNALQCIFFQLFIWLDLKRNQAFLQL